MDKRFYAIIKEANTNIKQQCLESMIKIVISRGKNHTPTQDRRLGCSLHQNVLNRCLIGFNFSYRVFYTCIYFSTAWQSETPLIVADGNKSTS